MEKVQEATENKENLTQEKPELTEAGVRQVLENVYDPELHMNIIELGLIYKVEIKEQETTKPNVAVEMTLTSPACPYGPMLMGQVPLTIKDHYKEDVHEVDVNLTFNPPWNPETMASEEVKMELGIW